MGQDGALDRPRAAPLSADARQGRSAIPFIDLFTGRSLDAKKALYQAIVRNLEPFGIPGDQIKVLLREIPAENWGIRGGVPASEVELGFEVNV